MDEDFENINSVVSENAIEIVSGSPDLEKINSIEDTDNHDALSSGSLPVSESGSFTSDYYLLSHDSDSGSVSSDQNVESFVQAPSGFDYTDKLDNITNINLYILLFVILIFIVTIFYRFRIKGGLR